MTEKERLEKLYVKLKKANEKRELLLKRVRECENECSIIQDEIQRVENRMMLVAIKKSGMDCNEVIRIFDDGDEDRNQTGGRK